MSMRLSILLFLTVSSFQSNPIVLQVRYWQVFVHTLRLSPASADVSKHRDTV